MSVNAAVIINEKPIKLSGNDLNDIDIEDDTKQANEDINYSNNETLYDNSSSHTENYNQSTQKINDVNDTVAVTEENTSEEYEDLPEEELKLTPYIMLDNLETARNLSRVSFLNYTEESYSGFLTVEEEYDSNLFFWFFPTAEGSVEDRPFIVWLQGGPGCSSMLGLFMEIGPYKFVQDENGGHLTENQFSWTKNHSVLFIDSPVGAGFSYTKFDEGYCTSNDKVAKLTYNALQQFFKLFPRLKAAPLYLSGESYAGKYVPALAMKIHENKPLDGFNLQGIALGNSFIEMSVLKDVGNNAYAVGLIDDETHQMIASIEKLMFNAELHNHSSIALGSFQSISRIIYTAAHVGHLYNFLDGSLRFWDQFKLISDFLNRTDIRRALHVGAAEFEWINLTVHDKLSGEFIRSFRSHLEKLLEHYRVICYLGQLDLMVPYTSSAKSYMKWNWSRADEFRHATRNAWLVNNTELAGYYRTGGGLTEVMIRSAGHMVPTDQPEFALKMIADFTRNQTFGRKLSRFSFKLSVAEALVKVFNNTFSGGRDSIYLL